MLGSAPVQLPGIPLLVHPNNFNSVSELFDNTGGDNILHTAIRENQVEEALRLMLRRVKLLFTPNDAKLTPLHLVCGMDRKPLLEMFIRYENDKSAHLGWFHRLVRGVMLNWSAVDQDGKTALHYAALKGQLEAVRFLVSKGVALKTVDKNGNQPLHLAAQNGHAAVVKFICSQSVDLQAKNRVRQSPYRLAERNRHTDVMAILTAHNAHDNFQRAINLIYSNDPQALTALLTEDRSLLTDYDVNQNSLMHHAVLAGGEKSKPIITVLFQSGMTVEPVNVEGKTPLCMAAMLGNIDALETLISLKANVSHQDKEGYTPLHQAAKYNRTHAIEILVQNGAYVDFRTSDGVLPLHVAIACKHLEAFNELVRFGTNINDYAYPSFLNSRLKTTISPMKVLDALWLALEVECDPIIKAIVDLKIQRKQSINVDGTVTFHYNHTLLHHFAQKGDAEYFKRVLKYSYYPFAANALGYTPLHIAAELGHMDIAREILENAVAHPGIIASTPLASFNIEAKSEKGETAWWLAKEHEQHAMMAYLVSKGAQAITALDNSKSMVQRARNFVNTQWEFSSELEQTTTFYVLNGTRMIWPVLICYPAGVTMMGLTFLDQVLSYSTYPVMNAFSSGYYKIKSPVHNYAHWMVEAGLDSLATASSYSANSLLMAIRVKDWVRAPQRRGAGLIASYFSANLVSKCTSNKQVQAFAYFISRELAMFAVDSYDHYAKSLENASDEPGFNYELNKALTIWSALLGKERGERFVSIMQSITQFQNDLYQSVGGAEHAALSAIGEQIHNLGELLNSFESYHTLMLALRSGSENLPSVQGALDGPQALLATLEQGQRHITNLHQEVIRYLDGWINENMLPEGEYRTQVILYSMQFKLMLLSQKTTEAETKQLAAQQEFDAAQEALKHCEEEFTNLSANASASAQEIESAEQSKINAQKKLDLAKETLETTKKGYDDLVLQRDELRKSTDDIFYTTPKGIESKALNEAQQKEFEAQTNKEIAETQLAYQDQLEATPEEKQEAQDKLTAAEEELSKCKADLETAKEKYFIVATSLEKESYEKSEEKRQEAIKEALSDVKNKLSDHYDKYLAFVQVEKEAYEAQFEKESLEYEYARALADQKAVQDKIYLIDHPPSLSASDVVYEAYGVCGNHDSACMTKYAIDRIVGTGLIDEATAKLRMEDSFNAAQEGNLKTKNLKRAISDHWLSLQDDYRASVVSSLHSLTPKVDAAHAKYQESLENLEAAKARLEDSKNEYKNTLGSDEQIKFEAQYQEHQASNADAFWKATHSDEFNQHIVALVGQPGLTLDFMNSQSHTLFKCESAAKWLIDYKYLFLTAPDLDARKAEEQALAAELLMQPLTVETLLQEKTKIENQIAKGVLDSAIHKVDLIPVITEPSVAVESASSSPSIIIIDSDFDEDDVLIAPLENDPPVEAPTYSDKVGAQVVEQLQQVFATKQSNDDWNDLQSTLSSALATGNTEAVNEVIVNSLKVNACAVSIDKYEKWEAPKPTPAPAEVSEPPKKKRHGLNKVLHKIGNAAVEVGKAILAGGASANVTPEGVSIGLNNQPLVPLYSFKPKPSPMQQSLNDWGTSLSNSPAFYNVSPSYNSMTPQSTSGTGPLMPMQSNAAPVLPLTTFTPSLAAPSVSVPLALPATPAIPLSLPANYGSSNTPTPGEIFKGPTQAAPAPTKVKPQTSKPAAPQPATAPAPQAIEPPSFASEDEVPMFEIIGDAFDEDDIFEWRPSATTSQTTIPLPMQTHVEPILPSSTFLPSLAPKPVMVPMAAPSEPMIPLRLPENVSYSNTPASSEMFKEPAAQAAPTSAKGKPQTSKPATSKPGAAPAPKTAEPFVPLSENPGMSMDNPFIEIIMDEQFEEIFGSDYHEPATSVSGVNASSSTKGVKPLIPLSTNSGMSMNNPFIQSGVQEHFEEVFEPLYIDVSLPMSESTKNASAQIVPLRGPEPPPETTPSDDLEESKLKKGVIGVGRGLTELGQGIKQLGLNIGEGLGLVEEGAAAEYTSSINDETKLYDSTPVGESTIAKVAEVVTDIALAIAVPEATAAKGAAYAASAFASGAALGALKPTEEGTLASHAKNGVVEGAEALAGGAAVKTASKGVHFLYNKLTGPTGVSNFTLKALDKAETSTSLVDKPAITSQYKKDARNNFNISSSEFSALSSKLSRDNQTTAPNGYRYRDVEPDPGVLLDRKLRALEGAQEKAAKVQTFSDGRVRYYEAEKPQRTPGPTRGRSHVTEWNPETGQVRTWSECYDQQGNVNRIRPKMIDGQIIETNHYPPTKSDLKSIAEKIKGPK
jgi:ankyrin repeat protein